MYWFQVFVDYFIIRGGPVMIFIFLVSIVAWFLGVDKLHFFSNYRKAKKLYRLQLEALLGQSKAVTLKKTGFEPFDDFLRHFSASLTTASERCDVRLLYQEFLIGAVPAIKRGFSTMSAWISVAPILGLFGTVGGMIETFKVIMEYGLGNPTLMAEGISMALITTQAGLTVAFPMVLFHNYLAIRSDKIITALMLDGEQLVRSVEKIPLEAA